MPYDGPPPDYREVPERIAEWYGREPNGRIVCSIIEFTEKRVVVKAEVYRDDEVLPAGVGHSYLAIPGSTPFTRGSELENAETSAAGRALVMAGIPAKNVASGDEVRSKGSAQAPPEPKQPVAEGAVPDVSRIATGAAPISSGPEQNPGRKAPIGDRGRQGPDLSSGGEGSSLGEGADPTLPTFRKAGPNDWSNAAREMKTSRVNAQALVLEFVKRAYGIKSLELIDEDLLRESVSAIRLAKRTVAP